MLAALRRRRGRSSWLKARGQAPGAGGARPGAALAAPTSPGLPAGRAACVRRAATGSRPARRSRWPPGAGHRGRGRLRAGPDQAAREPQGPPRGARRRRGRRWARSTTTRPRRRSPTAAKDDAARRRAAAALLAADPPRRRARQGDRAGAARCAIPSPEMRAAAAAGVVRAGGDCQPRRSLRAVQGQRPAPRRGGAARAGAPAHRGGDQAAGRACSSARSLPVQLAAARALIKPRRARLPSRALRPFLDAKADRRAARRWRWSSAEASTLDSLAKVVGRQRRRRRPEATRLALTPPTAPAWRAASATAAGRPAAGSIARSREAAARRAQADALADWLAGGKDASTRSTTAAAARTSSPSPAATAGRAAAKR